MPARKEIKGKESKLSKTLKNIKIKRSEWVLRPEVLLCPNTPKPMHGIAPRVILGQKWWDATRKAAYQSTDLHCVACGTPKHKVKGSRKHLEGHEIYDVDYQRGTLTYIETVPLCPYCHMYIHDGRLLALMQKKVLTQRKFTAVIQHGDSVLKAAGLNRPTKFSRDEAIISAISNGKVAEWAEWRLILKGKTYPPKFKTLKEWEKAHA